MNELAQNIILQGEENRPLPTGVTFRQASKTQNITSNQCCGSALVSMQIRIQFFYLYPDPDPGSQTKKDHCQTLKSHKKLNILVNVHAPGSRSGSDFQYGSGSRTAKISADPDPEHILTNVFWNCTGIRGSSLISRGSECFVWIPDLTFRIPDLNPNPIQNKII
jgi:hypothetical protein